jgi:NAD(P)-dependent dehydrogenase (short-subunit alcohol dehydrogenase family)
MPFAQEPYRLEGRTALIAGPANELSREIAAALAAAGASVSQPPIDLPSSSASIAVVESADILILQTLADSVAPLTAADDWESIERLHRALVTLPTALMAKAIPAMRGRRWGRVIFIAGGDHATPAAIAVRSVQSALMQTEARQVAAAGITVNLVLVKSRHTLPAAELAQAVAAATLYFASEESAFVTGQTLQVGGGSPRK